MVARRPGGYQDGGMAAPKVDAVVFDVNETLFSLGRLRPAFTDAGLDPGLVPVWFAGLLRDGFALTALGGFRPFADVAAETLRGLDDRVDDSMAAAIVAAMREMRPHSDVEAGLRRLNAAGIPTATLTNGSAETVQAMLDRAGLAGYISRNLSVDAVCRWKPAPEPYRYAATELGIDSASLVLVATHPWDCAGAHAAGLRSAWVWRSRPHWPAVFPVPDVRGPDLPTVIDALLTPERR
jgi:2-haloacid dehalogenase